MLDAVNVQRRGHHGHVTAGHDRFQNILGGMHAAGDGDIDIGVPEKNRGPVKARQQF